MVKTYNPKNLYISIGNHRISGYAEDSFVQIAPSTEGFTKKVGCDGEVVRSVSPDDTYVITLVLLQTANDNAYLQNQYNNDQQTGDGIFPISIKDEKGKLLFNAEQAWVSKPATRAYGREAGNREWEIQTGSGSFAYKNNT